nr:MAG TPA: hypothetical protein [Caudoviricetes sp.]
MNHPEGGGWVFHPLRSLSLVKQYNRCYQIDYCCYKAYFIIHIRILTSFLYLLYIFSYVLSSVFIFFLQTKSTRRGVACAFQIEEESISRYFHSIIITRFIVNYNEF